MLAFTELPSGLLIRLSFIRPVIFDKSDSNKMLYRRNQTAGPHTELVSTRVNLWSSIESEWDRMSLSPPDLISSISLPPSVWEIQTSLVVRIKSNHITREEKPDCCPSRRYTHRAHSFPQSEPATSDTHAPRTNIHMQLLCVGAAMDWECKNHTKNTLSYKNGLVVLTLNT